MQNIAPKTGLARRSRLILSAAFVVAALGVLALALGFFLFVIPFAVPSNPSFPTYNTVRQALLVVGAVLILVALLLSLRAVSWKQDNPIAQAVADALAPACDKRYIFIRNVSKLALGYIDAVLVGPPGVLVFRITDRQGVFFNEGSRWLQQKDKGEWLALDWSPTKQAVDDIVKLRALLKEKGLEQVQVFGAVVFIHPEPLTTLSEDAPIMPIAQPHTLIDKLRPNYFSVPERMGMAEVTQVAEWLYS